MQENSTASTGLVSLNLHNRMKLTEQTRLAIRNKVSATFRWKSTKSWYDAINSVTRPTLQLAQAFADAMGVPVARVLDVRYNFYEVENCVIVALTPAEMLYVAHAANGDDQDVKDAAMQASLTPLNNGI